jgi:hypothetical protein
MYYTVAINKTWTTTPVSIEQIKTSGFDVQQSRLHGDLQMFKDGRMCGWLFASQVDQMIFLDSHVFA